jgi:hypothetical protein
MLRYFVKHVIRKDPISQPTLAPPTSDEPAGGLAIRERSEILGLGVEPQEILTEIVNQPHAVDDPGPVMSKKQF